VTWRVTNGASPSRVRLSSRASLVLVRDCCGCHHIVGIWVCRELISWQRDCAPSVPQDNLLNLVGSGKQMDWELSK